MQTRIIPLAACPRHIEQLALALHAEWQDFAPWSEMEKIRAYYARCLDGGGLPLAWLAVDGENRLLGSAALKRHDIAELPQYEYWLGDVFVLPEARGRGGAGRIPPWGSGKCCRGRRRVRNGFS